MSQTPSDEFTLPPPVDLPPVQPSMAGLAPRPKAGFGGWMAFAWCLLYMVVMQLLAGLFCGGPLIIGAALLDKADLAAGDPKAMMAGPNAKLAIMLTLICSHLVGLAFGWFILRWRVGKTWKRRIAFNRRPAGLHVALIAVGFPAMMALATFVDPFVNRAADEFVKRTGVDIKFSGLEQMLEVFKATPLPLALFAVAVLPALNEELWCRGFLGNGLAARYAVWPTVIITSFLFGFLHVEPRQGTAAAILGVAIHFAYLATRSLWVAVGLHLANNALAIIRIKEDLNFPVLQPFEHLVETSPIPFFCGAVALFGAVAFALWQTRSRLTTVDPTAVPWEPKAKSGAEVPPPDSGVVVTHDPLTPASVALVLMGAVAFAVIVALG